MENGLALLENDLDQVFGRFYEHLLSDKHFTSFFGTDEDVRSLIEEAQAHFDKAQEHLAQGNWAGYGEELSQVEAVLEELARLTS